MIEVINNPNDAKYKTGDLLEVTRKDNRHFKCIVVESIDNEGLVCKILQKDPGVGSASWTRYGLHNNSRFQILSDCKRISKLAEAKSYTAKSALTLNESTQYDDLNYYETPDQEEGRTIVFCESHGYGGWATCTKDKGTALKEAYFNAQLSKARATSLQEVL